MSDNTDNPYEPPVPRVESEAPHTCPNIRAVRAVFYAHLTAVIASAFVVRNTTILNNRYLEWGIAVPLCFSLFLFPVVMLAVVASHDLPSRVRLIALAGVIVLSMIQLLEWLPTVQ